MKLVLLFPILFFAFFIRNEHIITNHNNSLSNSASISETDGDVNAAVKALENDKSMTGAQWGFCAYNLTKKQYIVQKNESLRLVPASVLKVFTTISAFAIAGVNARFETKLYYTGVVDARGTLTGDIIIKGYGDPTIACDHFGNAASATTVFSAFRQAMVQAGIRSIQGNVVGDASEWGYMLQPPGYLWEDLGNYYGAGASSLNYNENKLKVTFIPGKNIGDSAALLSVTTHPMNPVWINTVTTAGASTGDNVYVYGTPFQKLRFLTGTVPAGKTDFSVWASDPDPALRLAGDFFEYLNNNGIRVNGIAKSEYKQGWIGKDSLKHIHTHLSPPMKDIAFWINHKSHNVTAESVFRLLGMKLKNTANYDETAKALFAYWKTKGIDCSSQIISDGSGLSRTNMITVGFLVELLIYAYNQSWFKDFYDILPVAGKDGTLKTSFTGTSVANNMRGKSGLLKGVRSYTGYLHNKSGDLIAFAVIANGHMLTNSDIRKKLENLIVSLSDSY